MPDPTTPEPESSYNTPVDDPNHYNFRNADVPMNPDEQNRPGHTQHIGGYRNDEDGVDIVAAVAPKKDSDIAELEDTD